MQKAKFDFLLLVLVVVIASILAFVVNDHSVAGISENNLNSTSGSESYSDSKIGVNIEHPVDWEIAKLKNGFQVVKEKNMVYVEVRKNNVESSNTDLQQYVDDYIKDRSSTRSEFNLLNKTTTTISENLPAYTAVYTFLKTDNQNDLSDQEKNKILRFWIFLGGSVYTLAYVSQEGEFDNYLPLAQRIIESFKIKDLDRDTDVTNTVTSKTKINDDDDNSQEFSKKHLESDDVNKIENRTTTTAPIANDNVISSSPEVNPDNTTQSEIETDTGDLEVYENLKFGIKMLYPAGWQKKEDLNTESVRFVSPGEDNDDKYPQTIDLFVYPSMSLNQAIESLTNYYKSSLKNYTIGGSPHTSINANYSSVSMNYTYNEYNAGNIKSMDIIISPTSGNKTYLVSYRAEDSKFESRLAELQKTVDSLKFLK